MNKNRKQLIIIGAIFLVAYLLTTLMQEKAIGNVQEISYSNFTEQMESGQLQKVEIEDNKLIGTNADGQKFSALAPNDPDLIRQLRERRVDIKVVPRKTNGLLSILMAFGPTLLFIGLWFFLMKQMQGGAGKAFSFSKSKAQMMSEDKITVKFKDVAGVDEAKEELQEIVDFLKDPSRFQALGGRIPKGVLLVGSPGTGKTMLARAVAGEAGVPFFSISGSDFVEMFVGVGAARVRDLFEQGKKNAPCIIFIDEIDAVGRHRGAGWGGGNDEREQTLNAMLVEMDGFEANEGVIIIAATNRPDVLDPALLRPGRFDRQVTVPLPDIKGRAQILGVHMQKVALASDVDAEVLARGTPGFSGAELANLVNEAALMAARKNKRLVDMSDFEDAKDKVLMGPERRSNVMTEDEKRITAYHEAGHAICTLFIDGPADPLHKVTIIPRGRALGVTMSLPEEDRYTHAKKYIENQIAILYGGRLAEELIFNEITTGASNDIERATELARNMVVHWGMSTKLGPLNFAHENDKGGRRPMSSETLKLVDDEIETIVNRNFKRCKEILVDHKDKMEMLAKALLEYETLEKSQIDDLFAGKEIKVFKAAIRTPQKKDEGPGKGGASSTKSAKAKTAKKASSKKPKYDA